MDVSSAFRVVVLIPAYQEILADGRHVNHGSMNLELVVDRDTTNLRDLSDEISAQVKHGPNQGLTLSFWNKKPMPTLI